MFGNGRHPLPIAGGQEGQRDEAERRGPRDIGDPVLHRAQQQHAQHRDTEQAGARLGPDRDQQAGENETDAEQLHAPIGRKDAPVFHQPGDQRRHPDRHRGERGAFVDVRIVVDEKVEAFIAAPAQRGLHAGADHNRAHCQHDGQDHRFDPGPRGQSEGQEDREDQRLPDPGPLLCREDREIGGLRRREAIEQQEQHDALPIMEARFALGIGQQPACKGGAKRDEGDRQRGRQRPADLLRGQNVDIDIGEHPQERARDSQSEERHHEGEQREVDHGARSARSVLRRCSRSLRADSFSVSSSNAASLSTSLRRASLISAISSSP